jgi:AhpD family alkylhydroperoxidase
MQVTGKSVKDFTEDRDKLNELVMKYASKNIKRFYSLDTSAFKEGALDKKTKEMIGLVSSFVLRCDDCIIYHLVKCKEEGVTDQELEEALNIGLVVGGSITIPHLRKAFKAWEEMKQQG